MTSERTKYSFVIIFFAILLFYTYGKIDYRNPEYSIWDLHTYRVMAQASPSILGSERQPFLFRVLGPYMAGLLPFPIEESFLILSFVAGFILPLLLYFYLCSAQINPSIAAGTTLFFILNKYLYGFSLWDFYQINDLLALIEIILLFWTLESQKWIWFGILLFLGALTKEITLLMIPVAFIYLFEEEQRKKDWIRVISVALPAILMTCVLHGIMHPTSGKNLIDAFLLFADKGFLPETWFRLLINSLIPFSLVPLVFLSTTKHYFQKRKYALVYVILAIISTFFGYNNERLMAPVFIIFYPLLAVIIQENNLLSRYALIGLILGAIACNLHHTYARFPVPREVSGIISLLVFGTVTLFMLLYKKRITQTGLPS